MSILTEYKNFKNENSFFISLIKDSILYSNIESVISTLDFFESSVKKIENYEIIVDVGFSYLKETIELLKTIYVDYFNSEASSFFKYELLINYHLYLCELTNSLLEDGFTNIMEDVISINKEIIEIIKNKHIFNLTDIDKYDQIVSEKTAFIDISPTVESIFNDLLMEIKL